MSFKQHVLDFLNGEKMMKKLEEGERGETAPCREMAIPHYVVERQTIAAPLNTVVRDPTTVELQDGGPSAFRKVKPREPLPNLLDSLTTVPQHFVPLAPPSSFSAPSSSALPPPENHATSSAPPPGV
ncbi:hypothetical protein B9Z55_007386 [Caenorhabditis nigoni]|uniref:Uncharacterized protein n=1 Tax=Caenorhabditis nigoni TaxID=1611254 RepID=A0A2G5V9D9_9PELO|nr:hypothetical protein B9Z55_007386 [Caenorhabditis nigoni]